MTIRRLCLALLLSCLLKPLWAQSNPVLPDALRIALQAAQIPETHVAIVVQGIDASTPVIAHNASSAFNPASVMKLLTTYAALDLLGPAYRWTTDALTDGKLENGTLHGHLYLKGSGDPKFALEHFSALLRQLRVRGVQHIRGDLVLDRRSFNLPAMDPGAFDDKPMRPYNVGPDALLIDFRALRFTLLAEGEHIRVLQETPSQGLVIDNQLKRGDTDCRSDWKDSIQTRLQDEGRSNRLIFTGTFAAACVEKSLSLAPLAADAQVSGLFHALWKELSGTLRGQVREGSLPSTARLLARHESPTLSENVRDINKWSNNVMARQLFLTLGNSDGPATTERARQRIEQWLASRGLPVDGVVIENGSGLSRHERLSAHSINQILLDAWRSPVMPEFIASLPVVGIDGTMRRRLKDSAVTGRAHIKTGSLDGVRSAAGFALDRSGRRYAVTIVINHPRANLGQPVIDALLLWVVQTGL